MTCAAKICGLSTPETIETAIENGASHIGFIFFEKSPRHVTPEQAGKLMQGLEGAKTVAVSVNADEPFLDAIVEAMNPAMLQLHGAETPQHVKDVQARYQVPVIKALAIREAGDLERVRSYDGVADILLLDAKPPAGSDLPGGNGVSFDWSLMEQFQTKTPVWLSGGINEANVDDALDLVRSASNSLTGIDVSSGVESAPGVKDPAKIKAVLAATRR